MKIKGSRSKGLSLCVLLFLWVAVVVAQRSEVKDATKALEKDDIETAFAAIERAVDGKEDEKTMNWWETWYVRGKIHQIIYEDASPRFKKQAPDPLKSAYESYAKALEYGITEAKGNIKDFKEAPDILSRLEALSGYYIKEAVNFTQEKRYNDALQMYEARLKIIGIPQINKTDSVTIFEAGVVSQRAGLYETAINYYDKAIALKYKPSQAYLRKALVYDILKQYDNKTNSLKEGTEAFPQECGILLNELIDHYFSRDQEVEASTYLKTLETTYPGNPIILSSVGNLYERLGQPDKAHTYYKKALQIKSDLFEPNYFLGGLLYSAGVEYIHQADRLSPDRKTEINGKIAESNQQFRNALPYLEKAFKMNAEDKANILKLQTIYRKLEMYGKSIEMKILYENL